ncbi:MAG: terminase family protein [Bryobacterales bacterium]|nr:terminase family protein [Bryobacterales bacterium]
MTEQTKNEAFGVSGGTRQYLRHSIWAQRHLAQQLRVAQRAVSRTARSGSPAAVVSTGSPNIAECLNGSEYPASPVDFAVKCLQFQPSAIQEKLLSDPSRRIILNCTRQWGKSTIAAIKALHHAVTRPGSLTCIASPSARQSAELKRKIVVFAQMLGIPVKGDGTNEISIQLPNGSRIIGFPGKESTIRGFSSVSLLIVDEAAYVNDEIYHAVRPMLAAVPDAQVWLMSTPNARKGFFFEAWLAAEDWSQYIVPAYECSHLTSKYLDEERARLPERVFRREYLCEFTESDDAIFASDLLYRALTPEPPLQFYTWQPVISAPLIRNPDLRRELETLLRQQPKPPSNRHFYFGLDLGQKQDFSALSIIERSDVVCGPLSRVTYDFPREPRWTVRYLTRFNLGMPYPEIVESVAGYLRHPEINASKTLSVDATGVGAAVVDLFKKHDCGGATRFEVTITGGEHPTKSGSRLTVPRSHLLAGMEVKFQTGALKISDTAPYSQELIHELQALTREPGSGTRITDDLAFATALALWPAK